MVVVPYFLFSGVLVSLIRQHTELVAADHPLGPTTLKRNNGIPKD